MIGQTIADRYRIEAVVGRGGMGTVYRATDLVETGPVALKALHMSFDDADNALTRFHREFRVLARLDHPRIVRAHDYGTHQHVPYLTLEFLAGQTLKDKLADGPLELAELVDIARQICEALAYLHRQSIVHRDLKPGNLMLLPSDNGPQLKLMDFGLVRLTDLSMQLTQEGVAFGTMAYMAPEQAQGLPVDFRADLYALGIILYEMGTGRPPFYHDNPATVLMQQLTMAPPPPSQINPGLDKALEQLILELLAKEPAQRPASADLISVRLAELADGTIPAPTSVPTPAAPGRVDLIPRVPLIGREVTLRDLTQHWTEAQAGHGQTILIAGAAGVGKSRLVTEASLQVRFDDCRFLRVHCREFASLPFQPLVEILELLLHDLPPVARETLPPEIARLMPGTGPGLADESTVADASEVRTRLFMAFWEFFRQTAAQLCPLLIAIEDIQWADPTTLEFLGYMAQRIVGDPILLVLTYRPEEIYPTTPAANFINELPRNQAAQLIGLEPLSRDQVASYLRAALGWSTVPDWLVDSFYQATGGNPLFIEETLKALAAEGQVAQWASQESSQWKTLAGTTLPLPQSALALAERRLQLLSDEDRAILTAAAVLGPEFPFALLQDVARLDEETLMDTVDRLLAARLIEELPLRDGEDLYRFVQEALRQSLLSAISQRRVRLLHRRAGESIQTLYDTSQPRHWAPLAYHFAQAGETRRALKYCIAVGDAAARMYASAEAVTYYTNALHMAQSETERDETIDRDQYIHLYTSLGRSLELTDQFEEAVRCYQEMETLAKHRQDNIMELAALMSQATVRATPTPVTDLATGEELSKRALVLARDIGDRQAEAKTLWNLMLVTAHYNRHHEAIDFGRQSMDTARELDLREQLAYTLNDLQGSYFATGQLDRAQAALAEAQGLWRELGNMPMLADNLASTATNDYLAGEFERAVTLAEEALHISQSIENLWGLAHSRWILGHVYIEYGEPDRAIEALEETLRLGEAGGFVPMTTLSDLGWIYSTLGAIDRGLEQIRLSLEQTEEMLPEWRSYPLVMLARVQLYGGDLAAAEAAVREGATSFNLEHPTNFTALWLMLVKSELLLAQQNYRQAVALTDELIGHLHRFGIRTFVPDAMWVKGEALLAMGHLDEAFRVLTEARTEAEALGTRRSLWPILFSLSQVETGRGNLTAADRLRQEAGQVVDYIAAHAGSPDLRTSFLTLSRVQKVFAA